MQRKNITLSASSVCPNSELKEIGLECKLKQKEEKLHLYSLFKKVKIPKLVIYSKKQKFKDLVFNLITIYLKYLNTN